MFRFTSPLSSNNIFLLYHVVGLAPSRSHKSLLLLYMYTKSSTQLDVNQFCTLSWTNEYELQFRLHDDVKHTCAKMQHAMGASVCPPTPIKSHHSHGSKSRSFTRGCQKMDLYFPQNLQNLSKLGHKWSRYKLFSAKLCLKPPSHLHHHVGELHPTNMD